MPSRPRTRSIVPESHLQREERRAAERAAAELKTNSLLIQHSLNRQTITSANAAAREAAERKTVAEAHAVASGNPETAAKKNVRARAEKAQETAKKAEPAAKKEARARRRATEASAARVGEAADANVAGAEGTKASASAEVKAAEANAARAAGSKASASADQKEPEAAQTRVSAKQKAARARSRARERENELALAGANLAVLDELLDGIAEGVAHLSTDGMVLYANGPFAKLLGVQPEEMVHGQSYLRDFLSAECWQMLDEGLKQAEREAVEGAVSIEGQNHQVMRTIRLQFSPVRWKDATTIKVTASEMTELMQKNQQLMEKESSLHALSARILQLQEEERRRIARDLHDITGQELAVVIMQLMQVAKQQRMDAEAEKGITDAASLVRKIEENIRTLSYVLHPPLLDELGLGAALNWYAEGFTKRSGIEVKVELPHDLPRLTHEKEMAIFRVVQEALTNVLRHSGSHKAQIRLTFDKEAVELTVEDEGKGLARKRFGRAERDHGVGIAGMRERLQQFGGALEVRPLPKGTQVLARVPIAQAEPVEPPLTEYEILKVAKALGYKDGAAATAPGQASAELTARAGQTAGRAAATDAAGTRKRVLIADDHEVTRHGVCSLLRAEKDIEVCGEAKDALEAITLATQLNPDLIIMDLTMPAGGGFAAANRIRQAGLPAKIIFFSTHSSRELEKLSRLAGFEGFVQKANGAQDLVRGVRAVLEGKTFFGAHAMKAAAKSA